MLRSSIITMVVAAVALAFPAAALAVLVPGASGQIVTNTGCSDLKDGTAAKITCSFGHYTVVQWSTPKNRKFVSLIGHCDHPRHERVLRYFRSGARDRVNVRFTGEVVCTVNKVDFHR